MLRFNKVITKVLLPYVLYVVMFLCIYVGGKTPKKQQTKTKQNTKCPNPQIQTWIQFIL